MKALIVRPGKEPVDMPDVEGSYICPPDPEEEEYSSEGDYIGSVSSVKEYLDCYHELKEMC